MEKETLYRFYKGEATSDEQRRLMEWLDADQENRRIFDRERGMYNALLLFAPEEKAARGRLLNWRRVTRYAVQAAAVVILAVGILILNGGLKKVAVFIWHHIPLFNLMIMYGSVGYLFR